MTKSRIWHPFNIYRTCRTRLLTRMWLITGTTFKFLMADRPVFTSSSSILSECCNSPAWFYFCHSFIYTNQRISSKYGKYFHYFFFFLPLVLLGQNPVKDKNDQKKTSYLTCMYVLAERSQIIALIQLFLTWQGAISRSVSVLQNSIVKPRMTLAHLTGSLKLLLGVSEGPCWGSRDPKAVLCCWCEQKLGQMSERQSKMIVK